MADIGERGKFEKLDNFISVCLGFRYIVIGLQDLVMDRLKLKHMEIQQKCTIGNCHQNCSRKFGKSFIKWCGTCKYWKLELHRLIRYSSHLDQIQWNKIDSIHFPQSIEEMAKTFVKNFHLFRVGVFGDFSALMSLISNTTLFNISSTEINEILRIRNSYFANNYSVELNEHEKNICFIVFKRFLNIPEINRTKSGKKSLHCIEVLRLYQGLPKHILQKPEGRRALKSVREDVHDDNIDCNIFSNKNPNISSSDRDLIYINSNRKLEERLQQVTDLLDKSGRYYIYFGSLSKTMRMILIQIYFIISLFYLYVSIPSTKEKPKGTGLSFGKHHDVIGECKDDTEIMMIFIFLYCVRSIKTELRTDQCLFLIICCCCFIKEVASCCVILLSPTLLVISYIRMMKSSKKEESLFKKKRLMTSSKKEESFYENWFYQLNMKCDNLDIHCIIDQRLERKYKYLQSFYMKNELLEHILDSSITRSQNQSKEHVLSEFERIYSNTSNKHYKDRLFMKNVLLEALTNRFYILSRWVIAHKKEHDMTVTDMQGALDIAMEKHDKNIARAIAWCITRDFFLEFSNILIDVIDIYPGIRCLCRGSIVLDNPFCTNRKVITILTRVPILESPDTYHGFEIEEVNPDFSNSDDSEAVTLSDILSFKYTNSYSLKVKLPENSVENIFNRHSNITLICPSVLMSKSFYKVHAVQERICIHLYCKKKGIIPLGEDHFPTSILGIPTDIIEGNISFITKLRIGEKIGPQTSIGTLGGFVRYLDFDCFLTCAHVMYDLQTLLSSSYDFSRLPGAKAFCHSSQGPVDCGKVIWRTFDHDDRLKTSIDAALVLLQNNATFDPNDFILDASGNSCHFLKLGLSSPLLNDNCLDHEDFCIPQQTAKVVGAGSMTKLEENVQFPKQTDVDILFSSTGQTATVVNGNVFQPLWINSQAHMQLSTGFLNDKRIFRMYNQITINLGLQPGDSGTCIYIVQHPYNKNGCIGMAIAFCGGMTVVTPLKDILKRISSS